METPSERAKAKKQRILEAASLVFRRHGFARTSLDLIAQEAGLSRPAIYNFFVNKDALFAATVQFIGNDAVAQLRARAFAFDDLRERLTSICMEWAAGGYDRSQRNPDAADLTDPALPPVRQVYRMVEDLLAEVIPGGAAQGLAKLLVASMKGAKELADNREDLIELIDLQVDLVVAVVGPSAA